jgi:glutamine synthetase
MTAPDETPGAGPPSQAAVPGDAAAMAGARVVQFEVPDLDGGLRAKLVSAAKAASPAGAAMCTIMFGLTLADDVYDSPASSAANGYPDLVMRPDMATLRPLSWATDTAAVLCDLFGADGARFPLAPRTLLRTVAERCAGLGFEARFAAEWELCIVHRDDGLQAAGRPGELTPLGRTMNAYSSLRLGELRPLAQAFFERMEAVGIAIEAVHTELGHGMVEFAIAHAPALEAADQAARAKAYLKELCGERDLVATFMPKWRAGAPTSGCHFHQSLWRDGANLFAAPDGALSPLGRHYLAGQLATLTDFSVLFSPSVNSYRRLQPGNFTPATVSWGMDNRTAAIRVITGSAKGTRLEHRRPGADVNPYLAIAGMLAGGLHGIASKLEPPGPATADAYTDARFPRLPADLPAAIAALRDSAVAAGLLGQEFVDHYLLSREVELRLWREWEAGQVTGWEHRRYFETS